MQSYSNEFAAYEGVKGGEFYTPASIVKTIVAILKPFKNCRVYDPCYSNEPPPVQRRYYPLHMHLCRPQNHLPHQQALDSVVQRHWEEVVKRIDFIVDSVVYYVVE